MEITILTDNPKSWIIPYIEELKKELSQHNITHVFSSNDVVHPSKLPKGKGFSPLAWQILDGLNNIPVTLFEAVEKVDAGEIYLVDYIKLNAVLIEAVKELSAKVEELSK